MKLSGELDYRIRYDVEHDLFHAQNVFSDEYITPTFIEYVQELEAKLKHAEENCINKTCVVFKDKEDCVAKLLDLEKENTELKKKCYKKAVKDYCKLEKENAELKERLKENESIGNAQFWENVWSWKTKADQLTKAKELLKQFLTHYENKTIYVENMNKLISEAEQFLSEVEK